MTSKIKSITIIAGDYPAPKHMMLVFVQQLVHSMIDLGINITVIAPQSLTHALFHQEKLLPTHSIGVTESCQEYCIYRPYTLSFGNHNRLKRIAEFINRYIIISRLKKIKSDVLYAHFWDSALPIYEYALNNKIPLFVACGEGDDALEELASTLSSEQIKKLAQACSGVISVSSENQRKCIEYNLSTIENIDVFPNCVNTEMFHKMDVSETKKTLGINDDDFVISFVGGFERRKGPDRIASAVKKLNDPKIKVIFIGKPFKGYSYDFDCPGTVFKGALEHKLIPKYVNCSDVFVMPTRKEGCCNAIVEALAMGLPVISANRPFNDDILNDENSIRIDPDDIDALAEAIRLLRDDKSLRKLMSDYSLAHHEQYTIQGRAKMILTFINQQITKLRYVER